ncbi:Rha family transcriptional regulator, partial [uncultured Parasutterella sp.]|uniref:Rha family transcriptional regulator n=1 Tax=uncultured Parasutterella sp. TaxID=1263098 RepID=UPI0025B2A1FA
MEALVFIQKGQAFTSTEIVAEGVGIEHRALVQTLRKYQSDFETFGTVVFETRGSNGKADYSVFALLNEQQATLLVTYCKNTEVVRRFKVALVKAFYEARQTQLTVTTGDTLTPAQQLGIRNAVAARAQKEPAKYKEIYSALKRRFQVARYDQIMKEDYEEALTFIREMQLTAQLPAR